MAKSKTKKNYVFKTGDGKFRFVVEKQGDGKGCDINGAYPFICQTESGVKKLTRKETENWCLKVAIEMGAFPTTPVPADGNK